MQTSQAYARKKQHLLATNAVSLLRISRALKLLRNFQNQSLALFPTEAGIGNGLPVNTAANRLRTVYQIALYHQALDQIFDIG